MSLPLATANRETGSSMRPSLPFENKKIFGTPDGAKKDAQNIRAAIEHTAHARSMPGNRSIMGGISVGPTGAPQVSSITPPALLQAYNREKKSGMATRDVNGSADLQAGLMAARQAFAQRNSDAGAAAPFSDSFQQQNDVSQKRRVEPKSDSLKLLLFYNQNSKASIGMLEAIAKRCTKPHPKLFEWCVEVVDIQAQNFESPIAAQVIDRLASLPQFRKELAEACVLFDRVEKMAYQNPDAILQIIEQYKDSLVAALVDQKLQHDTRGNLGPGAQTNPFLAEQKQPVGIPRRSVLRGKSMEEWQRIADEEDKKMGNKGTANRKQPKIATFDPSTVETGEDQGDFHAAQSSGGAVAGTFFQN
jgi:hypothetical protein